MNSNSKLVCSEHVDHLRPFEEISIGVLFGECFICKKKIENKDNYAIVGNDIIEKIKT